MHSEKTKFKINDEMRERERKRTIFQNNKKKVQKQFGYCEYNKVFIYSIY